MRRARPVGRALRPGRSERPQSLSLSLGVIGPHPHLSAGRDEAAVAGPSGLSRDSPTRRRENVEQDTDSARRRRIRSRHRRHGIGRDRASALRQSGDL
jgi:hypothetical protein